MHKKKALIFGVTGQDGSYLARFLLKKNYIVHGIRRRSSSFNTSRINDIYVDPNEKNVNFYLHYGDITDSLSVLKVIQRVLPDEIYNLAAQSHVHVSFETPEYTANTDALGTLRILEAIKTLKLINKTKFYQAGTSELYGLSGKKFKFQNEQTLFHPRSPYAVAKLYAHWICINYRESYNMFCSNGILFNHESPLRGETFVTKKIVKSLVEIVNNKKKKLYLGNIYSKRDWGHAKDYVIAMWKILQQRKPDDYVIATGYNYSIKDFINKTLNYLCIKFYWKGHGLREKCYIKKIINALFKLMKNILGRQK
jgi:GDPmannose 4,6-dehydratase